jgi:hypothetical protein
MESKNLANLANSANISHQHGHGYNHMIATNLFVNVVAKFFTHKNFYVHVVTSRTTKCTTVFLPKFRHYNINIKVNMMKIYK